MVSLILPALAWEAQLSTDAIEVQTKASFELTVTVGQEGLEVGDTVRAVDPLFHGMRWAKWGYLSVNPEDCSALSQPNTGASGGLVTARTDGEATLALPIADVIDIDQERARLAKDIAKLDGEIGKINKKLNNHGFLAKAPEAVVAENRDRLAEETRKRDQLTAAMERLAAL